MNQQVALIRGINVGRAKRVAMADLRALTTELGYTNVRTLLNSGNVVFSSSAARSDAATRIQEGILERLGVSARVIVLTARQLAEVIADNSLNGIATDPARLLVTFLSDRRALAKVKPLMQQNWTPEALALGRHAAYLWCANGILESRLAPAVSRLLGDTATTRKWATVIKLQALITAL